MKLRNRIADISALQVHVLQDYFRMTVTVNFENDEWKPLFYAKVKNGKELKQISYFGAWEKIYLNGIENYSIDDMDVTIIDAVLKGSQENPFFVCRIGKAYSYIHDINDNRKIFAHLAENETETDILRFMTEALENISKFISEVVNTEKCSVPIDVRELFARKYRAEVKELHALVENDYKEFIEEGLIERSIKENIEFIKGSKNPYHSFAKITSQYMNTRDKGGLINFKLMYKFMKSAADDGILWACSWVGDNYYHGYTIEKDFAKAAHYYKKGFDFLTPDNKITLANIYLNNLDNASHNKEEAMSIINSCENPRYEILTSITEEGYEFYYRKSKAKKKTK